ncbi:MAG: hypothetical protein ABII93_05265 [Chrysiogenia bacterium]
MNKPEVTTDLCNNGGDRSPAFVSGRIPGLKHIFVFLPFRANPFFDHATAVFPLAHFIVFFTLSD